MSRRLRRTAFIVMVALIFGIAPQTISLSTPLKPTSLPTAQELFARHREAMGRLPSLIAKWSGSLSQNGMTAHYDITAARDGRFHETLTLPLFQRSQGSNGTIDWTQDENGNVQTFSAQHRLSMDARLVRLNDVRFDAEHAFVSGLNDVNGRRAYVVSALVDGHLSTIYIDAQNSMVDGADLEGRTVRYTAYRRFMGVAVPSSITETDSDATATITVDSVQFLNAGGVHENFDAPQQREPSVASGAKEMILNFDSPHGLIVISATINGSPVKLLLDSGSTTSVIDADLATRLKLPTSGVARVQGAGMMTGTVAKVDGLDVGGMRFSPFYMQAVPLKLPGTISHDGIDGILGYDFFASVVVRIAYRRDEVRCILPENFTYNGTGAVIPMDIAKRTPLITASVGTGDKGTFTVDSGSDANLVLNRAFADANRRDFVDPYNYDQDLAAGAGGEFPTRIMRIARLNLGSFSLANLVTEIVMRESGAFGNASVDGIVGGGSLASFAAVFLDYHGKRLILEK